MSLTQHQTKLLLSLMDEPRAPSRHSHVAQFLVKAGFARWMEFELRITIEGRAQLWKMGLIREDQI